jgi:hypothetical protein
MFAFYSSTFLQGSPLDSIPNVFKAEQCAVLCLENILCLSFDYSQIINCINASLKLLNFIFFNLNKINIDCYLNKQHITQNSSQTGNLFFYDHYSSN